MDTRHDTPLSAGAQVVIPTLRFGTPAQVGVSASSLYTFLEALPGLPDSRRFALISDDAFAPLRWLQSLDEVEICLPLLDLDLLSIPGYAAAVAQTVGLEEVAPAGRILLVTRYDGPTERFVTNLLAPILLDAQSGTGRQIILEGHSYALRQPLQWQPATRTFSLPC